MNCCFCKGSLENNITTHVVNSGKSTIVIKNVPCVECTKCGNSSYDNETAKRLEQIIETACSISGLETIIMNFKRSNQGD